MNCGHFPGGQTEPLTALSIRVTRVKWHVGSAVERGDATELQVGGRNVRRLGFNQKTLNQDPEPYYGEHLNH